MIKKILSVILTMSVLLMMTPVWGSTAGSAEIDADRIISTAQDLADFAALVNDGNTFAGKTVVLANDIDLSSVCGEGIGSWTSIGRYTTSSGTNNTPFSGTFDGGGHKIEGLYINEPNTEAYQGLFGYIKGAVIKNLKVYGSVTAYCNAGGIVGYAIGNTSSDIVEISNCHNYCDVNTGNGTYGSIGGIVGFNAGTSKNTRVTNCYNWGNITGRNYVVTGGIIGYSPGNITISHCYNLGTITRDTTNSSTTTGAGGIVGFISCNDSSITSTVEYCYNAGSVSNRGDYTGGIVGRADKYNVRIQYCYNAGDVSGNGSSSKYSSGIVGYHTTSIDVTNCYNTGHIKGNQYTGGLVGSLAYSSPGAGLRYSYNFGKVESNSRGGAIVGNINTPNHQKVSACYWLTGTSSAIQGYDYNATIPAAAAPKLTEEQFADQSNFPGLDFDTVWVMSEIVNRPVLKDNCFTVTLDYNDGETTELQYFDYNSKYVRLPEPERKGYEFNGWFTQETGGSQVAVGTDCPNEDHTLYAQWTKLSNTVTFDPNGGTLDGDTSKEYDPEAQYGALPQPTRTGYDFGGWFKTPTCTDSAVQSDDTVEDSHTLYAKWDIITYAISYELDGGTNGNNPASYTVEQAVTLQDPTKTGYTFAGWYDNDSFSGSSVAGIPIGTTGAKTFYAKWSINDYRVSYEKDGGTIENESSYTTYTYGSGFDLPTPTKTGYTFGGWYTDSGFSGTEVTEISATDAENKTFYAKWTANEYTVTFDYKGADGGEISETERPVTYDSPYGTLPTPTKTGHSFDGWYTAASGGSAVTDISTVNIADNHTLYAHWTADTYTVTYNIDGGTIANESNFTRYEYGVGLTLPTPKKNGYDFGGWYEDEAFGGSPVTEITDTDMDDKTYYAKWELITYTITYNLGGGTVTGNPDTYTVLSDSITLNAPSKVGHTFSGWSGTDITGTSMSVTIAAGSTGDREYTANWSANQYTVTFEYEDEDGNVITESRDETYGESYDLPNAPKRKGFTFGGWFTEENGQGDKITDDTKVDITTAQTLYASWIECQHEDMVWTDDQDGEHHSGTCDNCGKLVTEEHNLNDGEITLEPTTETEGEKLFSCTDCEATYTEVIPKHEHDFSGEWEGHDENGHWHVCPVDKATDTPIAHNWNDGEVTKSATQTEEGEMTYTCDDCGETKTEKTDKLPPASDDTPPATGGDNSGSSSQPSAGNNDTPSTGDTTEPTTGDTSDPSGDASEPSTGDSTDPSDGNNAGNVTVNSESGENAPGVSISEETSTKLKEEVIAEHLTPEERAAVANGDNLEVILVVEDAGDSVPADDRQVTEAVLTNTEYNIGMYLNVDLIKLINGQQVGKITELNTPIHVTIEIPEELRSANRAFAVVRVHDGAAEILEDVDDDPDTITILTDRFSTYSIAYQDTDANPNTGVATHITITGLACAVIIAAVAVKRKKIIE